jgi:3-dehydroquinate synthase
LHGEAISIGQVAAAKLSHKVLGLPSADVARIDKLFVRSGLPVKIKLNGSQGKKLFAAMKLDKKVSGGEVKFVLAHKIGKVAWGQRVTDVLVREVLAC